jgi:hypothetical protein
MSDQCVVGWRVGERYYCPQCVPVEQLSNGGRRVRRDLHTVSLDEAVQRALDCSECGESVAEAG